jgi:hypothetical protein
VEDLLMKNNNNGSPGFPLSHGDELRGLAGDLTEVHSLLSMLCTELGGGGIVPASDLEFIIGEAVPKLRCVVASINEMAEGLSGSPADPAYRDANPLLM